MSAPTRRSRRERKANPKYLHSAWDTNALQALRETSLSSTLTSTPASDDDTSSTDHAAADGASDGGNGVSSTGDEDDVSIASVQSSNISTPVESSADEDDDDEMSAGPASVHPRKRTKTGLMKRRIKSSNVHTKGVKHIHRKVAKDVVYGQVFGPELIDLNPTLQARDRWLNARDVTLPSRSTLASPTRAMDCSGGLDEQQKLAFQTPTAELRRRQILDRVSGEETHNQFLDAEHPAHRVSIGPWETQSRFHLNELEALNFSIAWQKSTPKITTPPTFSDTGIFGSAPEQSYHQGWLINFGAKVQCLSWAPCSSSTQYLAVSCKATAQQRGSVTVDLRNKSQSFHSSALYPSTIQIWAFDAIQIRQMGLKSLNQAKKPRRTFCLEMWYGDIRQLQWSPVSAEGAHGSDTQAETSSISKMLAVLSTDGCVRILSISNTDLREDHPLELLKVRVPVAEFSIAPGQVFTTLTWLSGQDLALGASDGTIRLYNMFSVAKSHGLPQPYWTYQLHSTYIMSLCPASPSTVPHIIASTSASGDLLLTDLRSPDQDRVHLPRARLPSKLLIYAPFTRSFITVFDHSGTTDIKVRTQSAVVCHNVRHFYSGIQVAKLPELSGGATGLAGSKHHPCILIGNARGTIFATNYLRKVLPTSYRSKDAKNGGAFLQKLCEYEWQATNPDLPAPQHSTTAEIDLYHGRDVPASISRFQEGFKPEKIDLTQGKGKRGKQKASESELAAEVMFEEEQAVTAIDWNPNAQCAGWAAMGWGSGIVRVQDLSYDDA